MEKIINSFLHWILIFFVLAITCMPVNVIAVSVLIPKEEFTRLIPAVPDQPLRVKINDTVIDFACKNTSKPPVVKSFCPLSLSKEAKYMSYLSVCRIENDLLCIAILPDMTKQEVEKEESSDNSEIDATDWAKTFLISGDTGRLIWVRDGFFLNTQINLISGKYAYTTQYDRVTKLDLSSGTVVWSTGLEQPKYNVMDSKPITVKDGIVCFEDEEGNSVKVNEADGGLISYDRISSHEQLPAMAGVIAMLISGYSFYEMRSDNAEILSWVTLGLNTLGWLDASIINMPFVDDTLARASIIIGAAISLTYPVISLFDGIQKHEESRIWRSAGGIAVGFGVPVLAAVIYAGIEKDKTKNQVFLAPVILPEYSGLDMHYRF